MKKASKDEIRELRILESIELVKKVIKRLDNQQADSISLGENLNRKMVEGILPLISKTSGNKRQNRQLRAAYKRLLFEMNDKNTWWELVSLYLTECLMEMVDSVGEHSIVWEDIIMDNSMNALLVEGRVSKRKIDTSKLNQLRRKYKTGANSPWDST